MAVPPAVFGAAVLAINRFPAHADLFQYPHRSLIVDVDGRDHAIGAQVEKCGVRERQRNLRGVALAPIRMPEHVAQIGDVALDQRQVAGADQAPGATFLDGEFKSRARQLELRGEQVVEIMGSAFLVARAEKQVARDAWIGGKRVDGLEVVLDEIAQGQSLGRDRQLQRALHCSTLPGFMMPFGSSARFKSYMSASSTGSVRLASCAARRRPIPCSALKLPSRLSTKSNMASSKSDLRARNAARSLPLR